MMDRDTVYILIFLITSLYMFLYIKRKKEYMKGKDYDPTDEGELLRAYIVISFFILFALYLVLKKI
ncbi:hypothetical protein FO647_06560 [Riemerella anatipestifer]|nr:hypothetical protein [Riemerella anatipestifer]